VKTDFESSPAEQVQNATMSFEERKISKILVVINPDYGRKAVDTCIKIIQSGINNPEVHLLYTVDMEPVAALDEKLEKKMYDELRSQGGKVIEEEVKKLQNYNVNPEVHPMYFGIATEEILRTEKALEPDLIIMGARGLSTIKKFLMGSISEQVSKKAKAPLLIAK